MSRIVYVNGEYLPEEQGRVSIFDRGFLFADGVYEVSAVLRGRLVDNQAHLARLHRSLNELNIPQPVDDADIVAAQNRLIEQNRLEEGLVYLQLTRGPADRDFAFPVRPEPTLVMFTQAHTLIESPQAETGITIQTVEDIRWKRRDIKTVGLLAPSMAKQAALDAGADDAWMVEDGYITEGTSNNAFIVTSDNVIRTRQLNNLILHGITRAAILRLADQETFSVAEGPFTPEEAYGAAEAFITSATAFALPVVRIDGRRIGDGKPGPVTRRLRQLYIEAALADRG
ncbi:MAG: D-amino-acid transaminase [Gammaproteobacteria bacterium]|nr:D-amino-acid transaminase [Gammaproteobacteria bacterium]